MFRLFTTSLPALALCLSAANATSAAPLEPLWNASRSLLRPVAQPGILPGGCYLPGTDGTIACPSGWCGTGYPPVSGHSPDSDCPNGLGDVGAYWPGANPAAPLPGRQPGAVHGVPTPPADTRPLPERSWPQPLPGAGMFEADRRTLPANHLQNDRYQRSRLRPRFDPPQRQSPGDFHILPVSDAVPDWFIRDTPFRP